MMKRFYWQNSDPRVLYVESKVTIVQHTSCEVFSLGLFNHIWKAQFSPAMRQNFRCIHSYFCFLFALPTRCLFYQKSENRAWLELKCCFQVKHLWDYLSTVLFSSFYSTTGLKIILFIIFNKKLSSVVFSLCSYGINGLVLLINKTIIFLMYGLISHLYKRFKYISLP